MNDLLSCILPGVDYYAFPTLAEISRATVDQLSSLGFGLVSLLLLCFPTLVEISRASVDQLSSLGFGLVSLI